MRAMNVDHMEEILRLYLTRIGASQVSLEFINVNLVREGILKIPVGVFDIEQIVTELHFVGYIPGSPQDHIPQYARYDSSTPARIWLVTSSNTLRIPIGNSITITTDENMMEALMTLIPVKSRPAVEPTSDKKLTETDRKLDSILSMLRKLIEQHA